MYPSLVLEMKTLELHSCRARVSCAPTLPQMADHDACIKQETGRQRMLARHQVVRRCALLMPCLRLHLQSITEIVTSPAPVQWGYSESEDSDSRLSLEHGQQEGISRIIVLKI